MIRKIIYNASIAGVSELVSDGAADALGGKMAATLSTTLSQGLLNGLLTAKLGLLALAVTRPVPFEQEERPRLKEIRERVLRKGLGAALSNAIPEAANDASACWC